VYQTVFNSYQIEFFRGVQSWYQCLGFLKLIQVQYVVFLKTWQKATDYRQNARLFEIQLEAGV